MSKAQRRKEVLLTHGEPIQGSSAETHPPSPTPLREQQGLVRVLMGAQLWLE